MCLEIKARLGTVPTAARQAAIAASAPGRGPDLMDRITQEIVMRMDRNRIGGFCAQ
jgi:hypothetical protein